MSNYRFDAVYLEHYAAGTDFGGETDWFAFTFTHFHFGRLLGKRMIGEDADPDFAGLAGIVHGGFAGLLDLIGSDAAILHGLETVRTKRDFEPAGLGLNGFLGGVLALGEPLAMFNFFGK
jgi:hypothetical protein